MQHPLYYDMAVDPELKKDFERHVYLQRHYHWTNENDVLSAELRFSHDDGASSTSHRPPDSGQQPFPGRTYAAASRANDQVSPARREFDGLQPRLSWQGAGSALMHEAADFANAALEGFARLDSTQAAATLSDLLRSSGIDAGIRGAQADPSNQHATTHPDHVTAVSEEDLSLVTEAIAEMYMPEERKRAVSSLDAEGARIFANLIRAFRESRTVERTVTQQTTRLEFRVATPPLDAASATVEQQQHGSEVLLSASPLTGVTSMSSWHQDVYDKRTTSNVYVEAPKASQDLLTHYAAAPAKHDGHAPQPSGKADSLAYEQQHQSGATKTLTPADAFKDYGPSPATGKDHDPLFSTKAQAGQTRATVAPSQDKPPAVELKNEQAQRSTTTPTQSTTHGNPDDHAHQQPSGKSGSSAEAHPKSGSTKASLHEADKAAAGAFNGKGSSSSAAGKHHDSQYLTQPQVNQTPATVSSSQHKPPGDKWETQPPHHSTASTVRPTTSAKPDGHALQSAGKADLSAQEHLKSGATAKASLHAEGKAAAEAVKGQGSSSAAGKPNDPQPLTQPQVSHTHAAQPTVTPSHLNPQGVKSEKQPSQRSATAAGQPATSAKPNAHAPPPLGKADSSAESHPKSGAAKASSLPDGAKAEPEAPKGQGSSSTTGTVHDPISSIQSQVGPTQATASSSQHKSPAEKSEKQQHEHSTAAAIQSAAPAKSDSHAPQPLGKADVPAADHSKSAAAKASPSEASKSAADAPKGQGLSSATGKVHEGPQSSTQPQANQSQLTDAAKPHVTFAEKTEKLHSQHPIAVSTLQTTTAGHTTLPGSASAAGKRGAIPAPKATTANEDSVKVATTTERATAQLPHNDRDSKLTAKKDTTEQSKVLPPTAGAEHAAQEKVSHVSAQPGTSPSQLSVPKPTANQSAGQSKATSVAPPSSVPSPDIAGKSASSKPADVTTPSSDANQAAGATASQKPQQRPGSAATTASDRKQGKTGKSETKVATEESETAKQRTTDKASNVAAADTSAQKISLEAKKSSGEKAPAVPASSPPGKDASQLERSTPSSSKHEASAKDTKEKCEQETAVSESQPRGSKTSAASDQHPANIGSDVERVQKSLPRDRNVSASPERLRSSTPTGQPPRAVPSPEALAGSPKDKYFNSPLPTVVCDSTELNRGSPSARRNQDLLSAQSQLGEKSSAPSQASSKKGIVPAAAQQAEQHNLSQTSHPRTPSNETKQPTPSTHHDILHEASQAPAPSPLLSHSERRGNQAVSQSGSHAAASASNRLQSHIQEPVSESHASADSSRRIVNGHHETTGHATVLPEGKHSRDEHTVRGGAVLTGQLTSTVANQNPPTTGGQASLTSADRHLPTDNTQGKLVGQDGVKKYSDPCVHIKDAVPPASSWSVFLTAREEDSKLVANAHLEHAIRTMASIKNDRQTSTEPDPLGRPKPLDWACIKALDATGHAVSAAQWHALGYRLYPQGNVADNALALKLLVHAAENNSEKLGLVDKLCSSVNELVSLVGSMEKLLYPADGIAPMRRITLQSVDRATSVAKEAVETCEEFIARSAHRQYEQMKLTEDRKKMIRKDASTCEQSPPGSPNAATLLLWLEQAEHTLHAVQLDDTQAHCRTDRSPFWALYKCRVAADLALKVNGWVKHNRPLTSSEPDTLRSLLPPPKQQFDDDERDPEYLLRGHAATIDSVCGSVGDMHAIIADPTRCDPDLRYQNVDNARRAFSHAKRLLDLARDAALAAISGSAKAAVGAHAHS